MALVATRLGSCAVYATDTDCRRVARLQQRLRFLGLDPPLAVAGPAWADAAAVGAS